MFSNSSKYAIKAVLYLALHSNEDNKIMVKNFSDKIHVPHAYIAKILQELSKHQVISSTKGPKGGFFLSEDNKQQPLRSIIEIIDGEDRLTNCLLSLESCSDNKPCPLHNMAAPLRAKLLQSLSEKTIYDLAKDIKEGKSFLPI